MNSPDIQLRGNFSPAHDFSLGRNIPIRFNIDTRRAMPNEEDASSSSSCDSCSSGSRTREGAQASSSSKADAVGPYDVMCGRHKEAFNNVGNRRFRFLVSMQIPGYFAARTKVDKGLLTTSIIDNVRQYGGRFIKWNKTTASWKELDESQTREKVGHALRDMATARRREVAASPGSLGVATSRLGFALSLDIEKHNALSGVASQNFVPVTSGNDPRSESLLPRLSAEYVSGYVEPQPKSDIERGLHATVSKSVNDDEGVLPSIGGKANEGARPQVRRCSSLDDNTRRTLLDAELSSLSTIQLDQLGGGRRLNHFSNSRRSMHSNSSLGDTFRRMSLDDGSLHDAGTCYLSDGDLDLIRADSESNVFLDLFKRQLELPSVDVDKVESQHEYR